MTGKSYAVMIYDIYHSNKWHGMIFAVTVPVPYTINHNIGPPLRPHAWYNIISSMWCWGYFVFIALNTKIKMLFVHFLCAYGCNATLMQQCLYTAIFSPYIHRFNSFNTGYFFRVLYHRNMRKLIRNLRSFHSRASNQNVDDISRTTYHAPRYCNVFLIATLNMDALLFISTLWLLRQ